MVFVKNFSSARFVLFIWKFSHRRNTYKLVKKLEYFHVQDTLFAMNDKRKYIKNPYGGKKRNAWNKPTKSFRNNWKRGLAKSDKSSCCNQKKLIKEYEMEKALLQWILHYDDDLDLVTTDESSYSGESEVE